MVEWAGQDMVKRGPCEVMKLACGVVLNNEEAWQEINLRIMSNSNDGLEYLSR